jgi:hypothetical protein
MQGTFTNQDPSFAQVPILTPYLSKGTANKNQPVRVLYSIPIHKTRIVNFSHAANQTNRPGAAVLESRCATKPENSYLIQYSISAQYLGAAPTTHNA